MENTPREEIDFAALYGNLLTPQTPLFLECYDSRAGESAVARLPFPVNKSGFTWTERLEEARESLPKASFRPTRPRIYSQARHEESVTVLTLEVPQKRGRGRPKKQSTAVVDAASASRNSFFVKRAYTSASSSADNNESHHNADIYRLHGHGGANVATNTIGITRSERHYLRSLSQPALGIEYDLDDQDFEWLKLANAASITQLTESQLEIIIEELELGWNALTQPIRRLQQRKEASLYPEEMPCEICGESDTSNCNVIVICDDCDLAVHQECYGVPHIPEGPWLCRTCNDRARSNYAIKPKCLMCPWPGSALRKTTDHRWVHSLCAHMIPETSITFSPSDPNDMVDVCTLQADRGKLRCVLCRTDHGHGGGYPMQCASKLCPVAFHPLCARAAGWHLDYNKQKAYCCRHVPEEGVTIDESAGGSNGINNNNGNLKLRLNISTSQLVVPVEDASSSSSKQPSSPRSSGASSPKKSSFPFVEISDTPPLHYARGSGEKFRLQTLAPHVLIEHIAGLPNVLDANIPEKVRLEVVQRVARYWSLKREFRRGTPLLKTLQLEPCWTDAVDGEWNKELFEKELARKTGLLDELHRLRDLLQTLKEREIVKAESVHCSWSIFEILSQPFSRLCEHFVRHLMKKVDKAGYFTFPVPVDLFPDYTSVVKHPMDFSTILKNILADKNASPESCPEALFYPTLAHFYADLKLIPENSRLYNTTTSVFYQAADRLEAYMNHFFTLLYRKLSAFGIGGPFDSLKFDVIAGESFALNDEFLESLPEPTPARFVKPLLKTGPSVMTSSSSSSFASSNASSSSSSSSSLTFKRRGRPPKNRSSDTSSSSSSISSSSSSDSAKKRGRPRKVLPIINESDEEEANASQKPRKDISSLCWAKLVAGDDHSWWPARIVDVNDPHESIPQDLKRPGPRFVSSLLLLQAFDPQNQWIWATKADVSELTEDLETDLESIDYSSRGRKQVSSAHRAALDSLRS